ncbi:MAG: NHL repeat-containing protein [Candidatus Eisenbacteria bacterium]
MFNEKLSSFLLLVLSFSSVCLVSCAGRSGMVPQPAAADSRTRAAARDSLFVSVRVIGPDGASGEEGGPTGSEKRPGPMLRYRSSFGGSGQGAGRFRAPSSVSVDSFGNVLVADTGNDRVQKFDAGGRYLAEFGATGAGGGGLRRPTDAVENSLSIYVVDSMNERILQYDMEGRFLATCVSKEGLSEWQSIQWRHAFTPRCLAFSRSGSIYVTDAEAEGVIVFSGFWEPLALVGGFGTGQGRFNGPAGISCSKEGEVLVCDRGNRRVAVLNSLGNPLGELEVCAGLCEPVDVDTDAQGNVYVADSAGRRVLVYGPGRGIELELTGAGGEPFVSPSSVAVAPTGLVYVVDSGADVVHVFEKDGAQRPEVKH